MNTYVTIDVKSQDEVYILYAGNSFEAARKAGLEYADNKANCTIQIWENGNLSIELSLAEL